MEKVDQFKWSKTNYAYCLRNVSLYYISKTVPSKKSEHATGVKIKVSKDYFLHIFISESISEL